jgi:hypothetical protein
MAKILPNASQTYNQMKDFLRQNVHHTRSLQAAGVADILADATTTLNHYDLELDGLAAESLSIRNKRAEVAKIIIACTSLLAPIRSLPPDVLRLIFGHYCGPLKFGYGKDSDFPPLKLSGVCSSWNTIVHSTPSLWSEIEIRLTSDLENKSSRTRLLPLCMDRSRAHPLEIYVPSMYSTDSPAWRRLVSESHRWRYLHLFIIDSSVDLPSMAAFLKSRVPKLETLRLTAHYDADFHGTLCVLPDTFHDAPRLRHAELFLYGMSGVDLPWSQLRTLDLIDDYSRVVPIVLRCAELENLCLNVSISSGSGPVPEWTSPIHTLSVLSSDQNLLELFRKFTASNLQHLTIQQCGKSGDNPFHEFGAFLDRSHCMITTLVLKGWYERPTTDLVEFLRLVHSVVSFSLQDTHDADELVQALSFSPQSFSPPVLPKLTSLAISVTKITPQPFIGMVLSRWVPGDALGNEVTCLRKLDLEIRTDPFDADPLRFLTAVGMNITIVQKESCTYPRKDTKNVLLCG